VRDFALQNAAYWLREFRFDGLRLDAVHAITDRSEPHLLDEMALRLRREFAGRELHLVLENENNDARLLERKDGQPRLYSAQWNDDAHHGLHVALTGEGESYYADYQPKPQLLPRALAEGFGFQGETMQAIGRPRGQPSAHLPPGAFVDFVQNHDQIGNRAFGDRVTTLASPEAVCAALTVVLLGPHVPMLFMGEEWGARQPFLFFCDFQEPLADAVRQGRRREFAGFAAFGDEAARERIPDPLAPDTFTTCRLDWSEAESGAGAERLAFVRQLLEIRRSHILPRIDAFSAPPAWDLQADGAFRVEWRTHVGGLLLRANLQDAAATLPAAAAGARRVHLCGAVENARMQPWTVCWDAIDG
jgi:maltooligosyltrehalose trehalohydrolase